MDFEKTLVQAEMSLKELKTAQGLGIDDYEPYYYEAEFPSIRSYFYGAVGNLIFESVQPFPLLQYQIEWYFNGSRVNFVSDGFDPFSGFYEKYDSQNNSYALFSTTPDGSESPYSKTMRCEALWNNDYQSFPTVRAVAKVVSSSVGVLKAEWLPEVVI